MVYSIYEGNMGRLEKKLTTIFNKCKQFGCEFQYTKVGEEFRTLKDEKGDEYTAKFILVEAEGKAVINDWKFVATIEHTKNGNIISGYGDVEVPERFYTSKAICEHCNSKKYRKDTYVVMNTVTGELKQVGKSCLKDFTNGMSAEHVARYISFYKELIQGEAPIEGNLCERYYKTETILKYAAESIKHFGYVRNQGSEYSTASRAFDFYCVDFGGAWWITPDHKKELQKQMSEVGFNPNSEVTVKTVSDALAWITEQPESNNYFHNLKTACSMEYITGRNFNLVVSLLPSFNKELEYQAEKAEKEKKLAAEKAHESNSQHIGTVGDRITIKVNTVKCLTSWNTDYGVTRLYKIVDENGNVYIWKTSNLLNEEKVNTIKGTVKEHKEFNGIKQTELTRCKVEG